MPESFQEDSKVQEEESRSDKSVSVDCKALIDCLQEIEAKFSTFLSEDEGNFLINQIREMYLEPASISELQERFAKVVEEPLLLQKLGGTWIAFLLWDDFKETFRLLRNHPSSDTGDINPQRYELISQFINSKQFDDYGFEEPLTKILFQKATRKKVLRFHWTRSADAQEEKPFPKKMDNIKPVTIRFSELEEIELVKSGVTVHVSE